METMTVAAAPQDTKRFWRISLPLWGTTVIYDTEANAESWRAHKAAWEGEVARRVAISREEAAAWLGKEDQRDIRDGNGTRLTDLTAELRAEVPHAD